MEFRPGLKSAKKDSRKARKFYKLHTTSVTLPCPKGFVAKLVKELYSLRHNFFT